MLRIQSDTACLLRLSGVKNMKEFRVISKVLTVGWKVHSHFVRARKIQNPIKQCGGCRFPFRSHGVVDTVIISSDYSPGSPVGIQATSRPKSLVLVQPQVYSESHLPLLERKLRSLKNVCAEYQFQREIESSTTSTFHIPTLPIYHFP